jgi:hypothetical protein
MRVASSQPGGYSADVQMHLSVEGRVFDIGQLGPDFIILRDPADHPPAEAEITFSIDGRVRSWPVLLPDGISADQARTRTSDCPPGNGSTVA